MFELPWLILLLVLAIVIGTRIRVVPDHERYAVIVAGRFASLKGPGLVFRGKGSSEWKKVRTGERGTIVSPETVRLAAGNLPARIDGDPRVGSVIRVTGFETNRVLATVDSD